MAGLWEKMKLDAKDRLNTHQVVALIKGYAVGLFTLADIKAAINANAKQSLRGEEDADVGKIIAAIDKKPLLPDKLAYAVAIESMMILAETGNLDETKWRADLELS